MKKLALGGSVMIMFAFLSASTVFGQSPSFNPEGLPFVASYNYMFSSVGVGGATTQTMTAAAIGDVPPNVSGTFQVQMLNAQSLVWSVVISEQTYDLGGQGQAVTFTVPDPNGMYRVVIRSYEPDIHVLAYYWFPNGIQLSTFPIGSELDLVSHLSAGPTEKLEFTASSQTVALLGGISPRTDVDYIVYQSGGTSQLVHAQKGAYKLDLGGTSCSQLVTLSFNEPAQPLQPVLVAVKSNGMQVGQALITPYGQPFNPQCPQ